MDYELLAILAPIILAAISTVLALIKRKYAVFGDMVLAHFKELVDSMVLIEPMYPTIKPLRERLAAIYDSMNIIWVAGEVRGWSQLMELVADFVATYAEIQKIISVTAPKLPEA